MKLGPDIAVVAALIGDPARANMLVALLSGQALTAGELAAEAGVSLQTASHHLGKLEAGGLVVPRKQGRHRYVSLAGPEVAKALEGLMGLAAATGARRVRTGPKEPALRHARVCYDHLAGELGVLMFDRLEAQGAIAVEGERVDLTDEGAQRLARLGLAPDSLPRARPLCRTCLDWSERRSHLGGPLAKTLMGRFLELGWADREAGTRIVRFRPTGLGEFQAWLGA
ncbi:helix-turn-helix domain-containing protein [Caulobacter sp. 17J65-9]|uniref:ArsR/SmtB family transcription factor n=1 Tax=Caulobacter sp. 17J65-9 TaxID=2709382 RepID=UPI0013CADD24|nr:helix-turn-helix domain-containing protein [Caulobacter sp. 17J65-9]NEX94146.1 helix-turn-helix transcriptional regulator [Caulobacter sp. 17J65-9]